MKTYEEMAKYVLEVRDETEKKRKHRKAVAKRVIPATAGVIGAVIIGFGVWKGHTRPDTIPVPDNIIEAETTSVQGTAMPITTTRAATARTTAVTTAEKSGTKTTVSATTVTTAKTDVATAADTTQKASTRVTTAAATERTTAETTLKITVTSATTAANTVTTREVTTTRTDEVPGGDDGGNGGLTGDGNNGGQNGGAGGYSGGGSGFGGGTGGMSGGGSGGDDSGYEEQQWLQLPINERYPYAYIYGNDHIYISLYMISPDIVGAWTDSAEMLSGQRIAGEEKKCSADVYAVSGHSGEEAVAIRFQESDKYYLYCRSGIDIYEIINTIPPRQ